MTDIMKLVETYASEKSSEERDGDYGPLCSSHGTRAALQSAIEALQGENERLTNEMAAGAQNMRWMMKSHNNNYDTLTAERDAYQQAADKMAAEHKAERDALAAKLDELQRQEPVAWMRKDGKHIVLASNLHMYADGAERHPFPLYAAPKALEPHEDTKLLDYLQERQATVEILMDSQGISVPLFRIGGLHGSICADIRGAIEAAHGITKGTP